jgi:hypothetical protein
MRWSQPEFDKLRTKVNAWRQFATGAVIRLRFTVSRVVTVVPLAQRATIREATAHQLR